MTTLSREFGIDPVLLATSIVLDVDVAHDRQLPDDPLRAVSVKVQAVDDDLYASVVG